MEKYSVAVVDDHLIVSEAIAGLINGLEHYQTIFQVRNGKELISKLEQSQQLPDLVLLDINMPIMDGFETANWLQKHYPNLRFLALSMNDDDESIIKMLRLGAKGYLIKDIDSDELLLAIENVIQKGFYYTDLVSTKLITNLQQPVDEATKFKFKERELEFINFCCSELTYREIAIKMNLSPKTIDGYREEVFEKLSVKSRIGLVMYAIKEGLVKI